MEHPDNSPALINIIKISSNRCVSSRGLLRKFALFWIRLKISPNRCVSSRGLLGKFALLVIAAFSSPIQLTGGEAVIRGAMAKESAADKRQRLRRLKKQLATIESLLQEDSDAAQAALAGRRTAAAGGAAKTQTVGSAKRVRNGRLPPPPQSPNTAAATTKAFGARGGPANARLRDRLKREGDAGGSNGVTDASFAAALQGSYRPQGPVSCEDTHRLLKEREAEEHEVMMRDAKVAAAMRYLRRTA